MRTSTAAGLVDPRIVTNLGRRFRGDHLDANGTGDCSTATRGAHRTGRNFLAGPRRNFRRPARIERRPVDAIAIPHVSLGRVVDHADRERARRRTDTGRSGHGIEVERGILLGLHGDTTESINGCPGSNAGLRVVGHDRHADRTANPGGAERDVGVDHIRVFLGHGPDDHVAGLDVGIADRRMRFLGDHRHIG